MSRPTCTSSRRATNYVRYGTYWEEGRVMALLPLGTPRHACVCATTRGKLTHCNALQHTAAHCNTQTTYTSLRHELSPPWHTPRGVMALIRRGTRACVCATTRHELRIRISVTNFFTRAHTRRSHGTITSWLTCVSRTTHTNQRHELLHQGTHSEES